MQMQFFANAISISSLHPVDIALVLLIVCVLLPLSRFLHPENIDNFYKAWGIWHINTSFILKILITSIRLIVWRAEEFDIQISNTSFNLKICFELAMEFYKRLILWKAQKWLFLKNWIMLFARLFLTLLRYFDRRDTVISALSLIVRHFPLLYF